MMRQTNTALPKNKFPSCKSCVLLASCIVFQIPKLAAAPAATQLSARGLRRPLHLANNLHLEPGTYLDSWFKSTLDISAFSAATDKESTHEVSKKSTTHAKQPDNESVLDHRFQNGSTVNDAFDHQVLPLGYNETPSFSSETMSDSQNNNNDNPPDKGVPMRPVQCARSQPIHSVFLVRLVGEPSLLTRYEKMRLKKEVGMSYNQWMEAACDGYHRILEKVELIVVEEVDWITQAHEETWFGDSYLANDRNPDGESSRTRNMSALPSAAPTSLSMEDPNQHYRPLYWLRVSGTCRNCPQNSLGDSNLLTAISHGQGNETNSDYHSDQNFDSSNRPALSSASLILEEVCSCPVVTIVARGVSNGTTLVSELEQQHQEASLTIDSLFPDPEARTSMNLLNAINGKIQQLRAEGIFEHMASRYAHRTRLCVLCAAIERQRLCGW
jgi:hypothetical protein